MTKFTRDTAKEVAPRNIKASKLWLFLAGLVLAFQITVTLPLKLWVGNLFNFAASPAEAWWMFAWIFGTAATVSAVIAFLSPKKGIKYFLPLALVGNILLYLQQNILVWDYGVLDGSDLDFAANNSLGVLDLIAWLGGIILAVLFAKRIIKFTREILFFSVVMALVGFVPAFMSAVDATSQSSFSTTDKTKFAISKNRNVIVINFDAYQSDIFWDIIDQEPALKDKFEGFKFYHDASGVFSRTYPSIPAILTGKRYRKEEPIFEFIREAYTPSLLEDLKVAGWNVEIYPYDAATVALSDRIADNAIGGVRRADKISGYLKALDLSIFRSVPHWIKPIVYNGGELFVSPRLNHRLTSKNDANDAEIVSLPSMGDHLGTSFLGQVAKYSSSEGEQSSFRFYSLLMPHVPFTLNRKLERENLGPGDSFEAYREYSRATVTVMIRYLEELKRLGIYDNTAIFFVSDHGGGTFNREQYNAERKVFETIERFGFHRAPARALLLYKPIDNTGPLELTGVPASLLDVAPTISSIAGLSATPGIEGTALEEVTNDTDRVRPFTYYSFTGWDSKYLDDFNNYEIRGNIRKDASWESLGIQGPKIELSNKKTYDLNAAVTYGKDIKSDTVYMNAFFGEDQTFNSTKRYIANSEGFNLRVPLSKKFRADKYYAVELTLSTSNVDRRWTLSTGGQPLEVFGLTSTPVKKTVFFKGSDLVDPKTLFVAMHKNTKGANGELRLHRLVIEPAELTNLPIDGVIELGSVDAAADYYLLGFWWRSWWGRWTNQSYGTLFFSADPNLCKEAKLKIYINELAPNLTAKSLSVSLNRRTLEPISMTPMNKGFIASYNCDRLINPDFNQLKIGTSRLVSEVETGVGENTTPLGVAVAKVSFKRDE